jgi:polar amino acid transport system permease protein
MTAVPRRRLSRRQQAKVFRIVQYVALVGFVVVVASTANWSNITTFFFKSDVAKAMFPDIITVALVNTVKYTASAFVFGLALGLVLALMRLSSVAPYRWLANIYIEFFRGVPALIVFLVFGFGVPLAFPGSQIPGGTTGTVTIALGMVAAAYMAETIRAGLQAVPKGQTEAARSLGMSSTRALLSVVIPQAFRIVLPPLTNELILLTKDSSLVYLLGLASDGFELAKFARAASQTSINSTPFVVAGLMYLAITLPLTAAVRRLEASARKAH